MLNRTYDHQRRALEERIMLAAELVPDGYLRFGTAIQSWLATPIALPDRRVSLTIRDTPQSGYAAVLLVNLDGALVQPYFMLAESATLWAEGVPLTLPDPLWLLHADQAILIGDDTVVWNNVRQLDSDHILVGSRADYHRWVVEPWLASITEDQSAAIHANEGMRQFFVHVARSRGHTDLVAILEAHLEVASSNEAVQGGTDA